MLLDMWLLFVAVSLFLAISPGPAILLALFGSKIRKMLKSATVMTTIRKSLGIAFVGFGAALAAVTR